MKKKAIQSLNRFIRRWYRHLFALPVFFLLFLITQLIYSSFNSAISDSDYKDLLFSDYKLEGVTIPKDLNFCGEKVPFENYRVKRALEKAFYNKAFFQPSTLILHKKAARWFPLIESILKKNGVPEDFKYVAILESGLTNSNAQSGSGGLWGIMPPVGRDYGLQVDAQVDERFNIEKATEAACRIFKDGYKKYKNYTLAAAAYDFGPGALDRQIDRQGTSNYYELDLNDETGMYIYRLLAFKEIISRPEAYGYKLSKRELFGPIPTNAIKVDSSISDLSRFAVTQGSDILAIKTLNPWLLQNSLQNPDHKMYVILFPQKGVKLYGMDVDSSLSIPVVIDSTKKFPVREKLPDSLFHVKT
ncbi:MAG: transglycosylase SLT domain-containing protein [Bacteroidia bacterium]